MCKEKYQVDNLVVQQKELFRSIEILIAEKVTGKNLRTFYFINTLQYLINGLSPINVQSGQHIKINKRPVPN